ncbi:MAG: HAMP domain-containing histidine kinase [Solirubrobacterales bacterium]|nr:HAMP domain-containing histidine kinase [Solirubrobacterales bacterium]
MNLRRPQTLRVRLVVAAAGAIVAALALFGVATVVVVRQELRGSLDTALRQRAEQVAELAVSAPAVLTSPGALESPVSGRQIVVEVVDARGRIVARSLTLGAQLLPSEDRLARAARVSGASGFEDVDLDGRLFRLFAAPIAFSGPAGGGAVLVASDTTDIARTTDHLGFVVVLIGVGVALLAALAAAAMTRRGLRPLRRLALAAGEIERTADPSRRLGLPGGDPPDEIGQLTGVLNRMLASLEAARAGERRFLADASHELRTPVTTLLGNVEYAARHGADAEVLEELQRDARRLARLVDDLLVLERAGGADGSGVAMQPVDLAEVVSEVVSSHDGRVVTAGRLDEVCVLGDAGELARALTNLVENALVHGPEGGRVSVSMVGLGGRAELTVRDEGAGPDPDDAERLFERFWRGGEASGRPGSGLGLSIVAAIASRHGGTVRVQGSAFTIDLPRVDRTQDSLQDQNRAE